MVFIRRLSFCDNLIWQCVGDSRIESQRQVAAKDASKAAERAWPRELTKRGWLDRWSTSSWMKTTQKRLLVTQVSRETVGRHDHEMVTRRPSDGRVMTETWPSDGRDTTK